MEKVRLGIIGCGVIGRSHVETGTSKTPGAEVVALADVVRERAAALAEKYGVSTVYDNEDALLNDPCVDAVVLALPTGVRTPIAYKALEKGKHLLLEKPVASNAAEVEKMIAMRKDRVVGVCSARRAFTGHTEAARRCVASGVLGEIRELRIRAVLATPPQPNQNPPPWRQSMKLNGGGILVNWGCYDLDYIFNILDWKVRPKTVLAQWWPVARPMFDYAGPGSDADSHFTALILCENRMVVSFERGEFTSSRTDQAWEIIGTEGTLHLPMVPQENGGSALVLDRFVPGKGIVSETLWTEKDGHPGGHVLADFVQAILTGGQPKTTLERALIMQKITDAVYASAASGKSVDL